MSASNIKGTRTTLKEKDATTTEENYEVEMKPEERETTTEMAVVEETEKVIGAKTEVHGMTELGIFENCEQRSCDSGQRVDAVEAIRGRLASLRGPEQVQGTGVDKPDPHKLFLWPLDQFPPAVGIRVVQDLQIVTSKYKSSS